MADIHVIFPPDGGVVVTQEQQPVLEHEKIFWHVKSGNKKVKRVEINFEDADAQFFPLGTTRNVSIEKELTYVKGKAAEGLRLTGSADLWGQAPEVDETGTVHKYTVVGVVNKGKNIRLDPVIITDRPRV